MWHAQDHMSSLCQSEKLHLHLSPVRVVVIRTLSFCLQVKIDLVCVQIDFVSFLCLQMASFLNKSTKQISTDSTSNHPNAVAQCTLEESAISTSNYPVLQKLLDITG